jgi:hypothetical protein
MTARCRFTAQGLAVALDLPRHVELTGISVSGDLVDLELSGATLDPPPPGTSAAIEFAKQPPPEELVVEYEVGPLGRRRFLRFKLPEEPADAPLGSTQLNDEIAAGIAALYPPTEVSSSPTLVDDEIAAGIAAAYPPGETPGAPTLVDDEIVAGIAGMYAEDEEPKVEETLPPSGKGSRGGRRTRKE